ncbi:MAG: Fur family transcriptional regulator [Brevundimonas sp.]|uniref:Fur family transcriptional regulator n=1 Tax=Brevundimonas sp. TaxID=1871086 RepID=UPI00391A4DFC
MSASCQHHDHSSGLSGTGLEDALSAAEARCAHSGERMTAPRRRVLELLLEAGAPVKAYDLISGFGADGQAAKPPTVYRALEFLENQGLVHRIASISAYVACRSAEQDHAAAFLICDCCGATAEISPIGNTALAKAADEQGFRLARTTIEAHGLCEACAGSSHA